MKTILHQPHASLDSPIHRLDPRTKIVCCLLLMLLSVSTPPQAVRAFAGYLGILLATVAFSRVPFWYVFKRSLVVLPFSLMAAIFVPFLHAVPSGTGAAAGHSIFSAANPGWIILWNVLIKSYIGVVCVIVLSCTTPFPELLQGLQQLKIPRLFVLLTGFVYRYVLVLADEARRMHRATLSRGYGGRWLWQAGVVGHLIGTLFLRSYERAERVYVAMISRGFTQDAADPAAPPLGVVDYLALSLVLAAALGLRTTT